MKKVAQYLQEHLVGEVITSPDAREYFSTDASIFRLTPQIIVYPRTENDVRKSARFAWQLAERGRAIPITARGLGSDQSGAAIGSGIMLVFPAHMSKILVLDSSKGNIVVQPGLNYGRLQQTLHTHGLFLPPYPASLDYSSIGGALANNSAGEKSIKYGVMKDYVRQLRVVLANGEVITTGRLSKRELNSKKGLATFEGEIYRAIDGLIEDNRELVEKSYLKLRKNTAGYDIWNVKDKNGGLDLMPLFVGSQGTLGIITEARLDVESFNPQTTLVLGMFDDLDKAAQAILKLDRLEPSALELVDKKLLDFVEETNPPQLSDVLKKPYPEIVLLIEFDDNNRRIQLKKSKKALSILSELAINAKATQDEQEQEDLWKIRHSAASVSWYSDTSKRALPIIEDAVVPLEQIAEFFKKVYSVFDKIGLDYSIWGHAGSGNFHIQPLLDLNEVGDRQKVFKLMDIYYKLVIELGGSITGEHNDGRLRAPYVKMQYGEEVYKLFEKIKQIFDPFDILNPGVKMNSDIHDIQQLMRLEYNMSHFYDHMPRT